MEKKRKTSAAKRAANARYYAKTMKQYKIALHSENDKDIINKLEQTTNKTGYIKQLIREDMQKGVQYND